jgi:hypothetical protein
MQTSSLSLGTAVSVVLIVLGTAVPLATVFLFVASYYSKLARELVHANQTLLRSVWAQQAAREPSAPGTERLIRASAGDQLEAERERQARLALEAREAAAREEAQFLGE